MSTIVFPAPQPWRKLYIAALFEDDREQLARRISQARSAAIKRSRELFQQDPRECNEERNALDNALRFLDLIEANSRKTQGQPRRWFGIKRKWFRTIKHFYACYVPCDPLCRASDAPKN